VLPVSAGSANRGGRKEPLTLNGIFYNPSLLSVSQDMLVSHRWVFGHVWLCAWVRRGPGVMPVHDIRFNVPVKAPACRLVEDTRRLLVLAQSEQHHARDRTEGDGGES
jgi:hypothetical protein